MLLLYGRCTVLELAAQSSARGVAYERTSVVSGHNNSHRQGTGFHCAGRVLGYRGPCAGRCVCVWGVRYALRKQQVWSVARSVMLYCFAFKSTACHFEVRVFYRCLGARKGRVLPKSPRIFKFSPVALLCIQVVRCCCVRSTRGSIFKARLPPATKT